jgi:hypothetical protein
MTSITQSVIFTNSNCRTNAQSNLTWLERINLYKSRKECPCNYPCGSESQFDYTDLGIDLQQNSNVTNTPYEGLMSLRVNGMNNDRIPITSIEGRRPGVKVPFNVGLSSDYEDFKMRRKAETLKFRNGLSATGYNRTASERFSDYVKPAKGAGISRAHLQRILAENNGTIPDNCIPNNAIILSSPSKSGVRGDNKTPGYYLDPNVTYYPIL